MSDLNGYKLSRKWFDFCFENPDKIKPNHGSLYFFCIELCNRLGWKEKFGLPASIAQEATGMKSYNTYKKTLDDLVEFGFISVIQKSKNQYTANIIALSNFNKALNKALDNAIINQSAKQNESIKQRTYNINKPLNYQTNETKEPNKQKDFEWILKTNFFKKISDFFSQNTEVLKKRMHQDLIKIYNTEKYNEFENQTIAYINFKKRKEEKIHRWQNFIQDWESENWVDKLKKIELKQEYKSNGMFNPNRTSNGKISGRSAVANGDIDYFEFTDDY